MSFLVELPEDQYSGTAFTAFGAGSDFSIGNARAMIWMSQLAYEVWNPQKIENIRQLWGLDTAAAFVAPFKSVLPMPSTRGIIAARGNATIIAFAGTDPLVLNDWITDFWLPTSADDVHEGFADAAERVWDNIGPAMKDSADARRPLFITGHSLGGAIAAVAAERALRENKIDTAQVYTFGMPRAGKQDFAERFAPILGNITYRLVHGNDIVPTVPPQEVGFRHVGRLLQCASGGTFDARSISPPLEMEQFGSDGGGFASPRIWARRLISAPTSPSFRRDALGQLFGLLPAGIGDHLPDRYYHALE